ncbi:DNA repair protein RAD51 homolog 3 isoform X3 [Euphorbia lathyris]|uniref:DNA repair protein RAD51 homolog 3 isoform X3 n=1 Tax=Euphorbia lathyris TaxID=212925 RepID=UPI0033135BB7
MEVSRLPLSATQRGKLISAGYTSLCSLSSVSSSDLARDLKISDSEALDILNVASRSSRLDRVEGSHSVINGAQNAWDMLHEEKSLTRITTSSADLDNILGGGISCKEVTEIDTEGSFMVERALQVAEACVEDMLEYSKFLHKGMQTCQAAMQSKDILGNIYYFRVCSYTEQIALINYLDKFISEHKDVKVVIIDSITFHFRQDFDDMSLRTRVLSGMALKLMKIATNFRLAVVLLNQVTTKLTEGSFQLGLALGDSWSHSCTNRIILYWNGNERYAYIDKSPSLRSASAPYSVTSRGIRNSTSNSKRAKLM